MNGLRKVFYLLLVLLPVLAGAKEIGPNVGVYRGQELKWEDGAYSYHVMFKSLLANLNTGNDNSGGMYNPQADACLDSSAYTLGMSQVPIDAQIEKAFIIWTGAQPTAKLNDFTDNTIRLDFTHESENAMNTGLDVVGRQSRLTDAQDFEYEAVVESDTSGDRGFFTYRVDVTDFFKQIQETGRTLQISDGTVDGMSLYGIYSVSGLDCTNDAAYYEISVMVSSWAIVLVYNSAEVTPKKLYIYDGFYGYQHMNSIIQITGFEFPDKPSIRLSMMVNEGDPGLVQPSTSTIPESLQIKGDGVNYNQLFNSCNYLTQANNAGQPFLYTEIFNSISSEYAFDPTAGETCVGGIPPNAIDTTTMEYAIDMDTFYIDAAEGDWAQQFFKGGQQITLNLGANQDWILTNFLIMSHDTRAGLYDIPGEDEKGYCSCAPEEKGVCYEGQEYVYTIKIQNWGDDIVTGVKVQDSLSSPYIEYVAGTTQIATKIHEDEAGNWIGEDWTAIADGPGGVFPLAQPYLVAEQMNYCELPQEQCPGDHDRRMVRFKVRPKDGIPKHAVIENTALISDPATVSKPYKTNTAVPLKLHSGSCLPLATCEDMDMSECGGPWEAVEADTDTTTDSDIVTNCETSGVKVEYAIGKNSPTGDIIIPSPSNGLTLGQFTLLGTTTSGKKDCTFKLNKVKLKIEKEQTATLSELKLIHDANGNGKFDNGETEVGTTATLEANYAEFEVPSTKRAFPENTLLYFVVVADASVNAASIPANITFQAVLENAASLLVADAGTAQVTTDAEVKFAKYMFEPDGKSFIITRGEKDPSVPATAAEVNTYREILQLRTKSKGDANILKAMTVRATSGYALFGEGLQKVGVYIDNGGDGTGDTLLAEGSAPSGEAEFELTFATPLTYAADEEKFLVIKADFNLSGEVKGLVQVKKAGLTLDKSVQIFTLPIDSKEYTANCDPNDPNCIEPEPEDDCTCTMVGSNGAGFASFLFMLLMGALLLFISRRVYGDK